MILQPALLGGLFIGVLSALPIVNSANACCCLWVIVGGVLTVYLQQQKKATAVESGEAALGGLLAGAIGALIYIVIVAVLLTGTSAGVALEEQTRAWLDQSAQVPLEVRDMVLNTVAGRNVVFLLLFVTLPIYSAFAMLGALLGLTIFKKKTPTGSGT